MRRGRPYHLKISRDPMRVLVRHADAGLNGHTDEPCDPFDDWRGLSPHGHEQAAALVERIGCLPILKVLSSPASRCRQTVAPLARETGLRVEPSPLLAAGVDPVRLADFLLADDSANSVLCTHPETLLAVFGHLALVGSRLVEGIARMTAGAAWVLYGGAHGPVRLRYLSPPRRAGDDLPPPYAAGS